MKILVGSDIHSNLIYATFFVEKILQEKPDKVILLGDLMNVQDKELIKKIFSKVDMDILCVEGNCDILVSDFGNIKFVGSYIIIKSQNSQIFFTHGHMYNKYNIPPILKENDLFVYGHLHIPEISKKDGIIFANCGSVGKPRNGTKNSYMIIDDNKIEIRDVEFNQLIVDKKL